MQPTIVGIAGGSASGKTTTASALAEQLGARCALLTLDRYYLTLPDRYRADPVDYNFDHPDAVELTRLIEDLSTLRAGRAAAVPRYDFALHSRLPDTDELLPREVVLVEGIHALCIAPLRAVMDFKVFVHAPADIRLARRIRRDLVDRGREAEQVLAQYERTVRPMHEQFVEPSKTHADLVVDGTTTTGAMVMAVRGLIGM